MVIMSDNVIISCFAFSTNIWNSYVREDIIIIEFTFVNILLNTIWLKPQHTSIIQLFKELIRHYY